MEKLAVQIDHEATGNRPLKTRYRIRIDMGGGLSPREKAILLNSARSCHVHKMLAGEVRFDVASV